MFATIYTFESHNSLGMYMEKKCIHCEIPKPLKSFYTRHTRCIDCWNYLRRDINKKSKCRQCITEFRPGVRGRYKFCSEVCRFMNKVKKDEITDCWLWQAGVTKTGYGCFVQLGKKSGLAHRASYRLFKKTIPECMGILHSCHVPACVNPDHLRPGTPKDNALDKVLAGRSKKKNSNSVRRKLGT